MRERQDDAAAQLDRELFEAFKSMPSLGAIAAAELSGPVTETRNRLIRAWQRTIVLKDQEIDDRIWALSMALLFADHDASAPFGRETG